MPGLMQQPPPRTSTPAGDMIWRHAPVALAVVGPDEVLDSNVLCRQLLSEAVGGSEQAGQRWLCAAVTGMLVRGRDSDLLRTGAGDETLAVRLSSSAVADGARVVTLAKAHPSEPDHESLAGTVSTLSHELRTPLTSMKSSLDVVTSGEAGPVSPDQSRFLGMTLRNINRLERLVGDLLDVSRSGPDGQSFRRRETDLGPLLREALQMQAAAAAEAGLDLNFSGLPTSLWAHVDPDRLLQILANILGNAIKYTPSGGLVRVGVEARSRPSPAAGQETAAWLAGCVDLPMATIHLVVEDNGPGMSREDLDRIFEPWFRCGGPGEGRIPGAGLGLSITRSLVEAHGGCIRIASEPGHGTGVWIDLPRDPVSGQIMSAAREVTHQLAQAPRSVLAILDGRSTRPDSGSTVADTVREFHETRQEPGTTLIELTESVWLAVVTSTSSWRADWQDFRAKSGISDWPDWGFPKREHESRTSSQQVGFRAEAV